MRAKNVARTTLIALATCIMSQMAADPAAPIECLCQGDDFEDGSLLPLWVNSGNAGTGSETGGRLVMTKNGGIVGAVYVALDGGAYAICGDFDISVDFDLTSFPAASVGSGRYHAILLGDGSQLIAGAERYREQANSCVPYTDSYKFYTTTPGCTPEAVYVPSSDLQGRLRLARSGTAINAYYKAGASWILAMSRSITTAQVYVAFSSGTNGSLTTAHEAAFDNLTIWSSDPSCAICTCPHLADFEPNGFTDAVDLAVVIDIVFFGAADIQDPSCPATRADFNNDGFADSVDLAFLIDHVFFGGAGPVDPCL